MAYQAREKINAFLYRNMNKTIESENRLQKMQYVYAIQTCMASELKQKTGAINAKATHAYSR